MNQLIYGPCNFLSTPKPGSVNLDGIHGRVIPYHCQGSSRGWHGNSTDNGLISSSCQIYFRGSALSNTPLNGSRGGMNSFKCPEPG